MITSYHPTKSGSNFRSKSGLPEVIQKKCVQVGLQLAFGYCLKCPFSFTVEPMRDTEVVASIRAADPEGLAEAYDRYAARIFSFCRGLLGEPADATGAVRDTYVIAVAAVDELHDPGRLRPWLYAVARNECHRRLRAGAPAAAPAETLSADGQDDGDDDDRGQPLALVRAPISQLDLGDRELVELSLRHRLHGADLADILGAPRHQVQALAAQARERLGAALRVLVVAQVGRKACPDLDQLLTDAEGMNPARLQRQVNAHIAGCAVCGERKRQVVGAGVRLGGAPPGAGAPQARETAAERAAIETQAAPFGAYGFPVPQTSSDRTAPWWQIARRPVTAI